MKKSVAKILGEALKKINANSSEEEIEKSIEIPPSSEMRLRVSVLFSCGDSEKKSKPNCD